MFEEKNAILFSGFFASCSAVHIWLTVQMVNECLRLSLWENAKSYMSWGEYWNKYVSPQIHDFGFLLFVCVIMAIIWGFAAVIFFIAWWEYRKGNKTQC